MTSAQEKLIKEAQSEAFSDEGLESFSKKVGMKIALVTIYEEVGLKIPLKNKLAEADGNPFFLMYENLNNKERCQFQSISTYTAIEKEKEGKPLLDEKEGFRIIKLSTDDLVYVPTKEELENLRAGITENKAIDWNDKKKISDRIYRVNDFSKSDIYFKPNRFSQAIKAKELHTSFDGKCSRLVVFPQKNKGENGITEEPEMIIDICIKINVDRLGNILLIDK